MLLAAALTGTALHAVAPAAADVAVIDRIVAVVDGRPITVGTLRRLMIPYLRRLKKHPAPAWQKADWLREAMANTLEQAIDQTLIERAAEGLGVKVDDAAVDRRIDDEAAKAHQTRATLMARMWEDGYTEADVRVDYKRRMIYGLALHMAYGQTHEDTLPLGESEKATRASEVWRAEWRVLLRHRATIERRFQP